MGKTKLKILVFVLIIAMSQIFFGIYVLPAQDNESFSPFLHNGTKWRIAMVEGKTYVNYPTALYCVLLAWQQFGWLDFPGTLPYIEGQTDTKIIWDYVCANNTEKYLEFIPEEYYRVSDLSADQQTAMIDRLNKGDIDVVIALGTAAGQALSGKVINSNITVYSSSDPLSGGVVKADDYSGIDNVWAPTDPQRFTRQLSVFCDLFKISRMGIVYENTPITRTYIGYSDIQEMSEKRGFKLKEMYVKEYNPNIPGDDKRYKREIIEAYKELAPQVDAFYLTLSSTVPEWLPEILQPFYDNDIPVFSQLGELEVEDGALLSVSLMDFQNVGVFGAKTTINMFKGEKLSNLPQIYYSSTKILVNMNTATEIQYKVPFDVLLVADKIYVNP